MKTLFDRLDDALDEAFNERAAIMHFDGGLPKEKTEALARAEVETYRRHREKLAMDSKPNK